jgi:hypothetical protein
MLSRVDGYKMENDKLILTFSNGAGEMKFTKSSKS